LTLVVNCENKKLPHWCTVGKQLQHGSLRWQQACDRNFTKLFPGARWSC